jgi:hypothetical protein
MIKFAGAFVGVALVATVATAGPDHRNVTAPLARLRERGGVCASDESHFIGMSQYFIPKVCIQTGQPKTMDDDKRPMMFVNLETSARWGTNVRQWQLTVIGPDGKQVLKRRLTDATGARFECEFDGCNSSAVWLRPPAWKPGTYRFHLVDTKDIDLKTELSITLQL